MEIYDLFAVTESGLNLLIKAAKENQWSVKIPPKRISERQWVVTMERFNFDSPLSNLIQNNLVG